MSPDTTGAYVALDTQVGEVDTPPNVYWVPVKGCCPDLLINEECDCDQFAAEAAALFTAPIFLDLRGPQLREAEVPA